MAIRRCFLRNEGFSIAANLLFADNYAGRYPQRQNSVTIFPNVFVLLFSLLVGCLLKSERKDGKSIRKIGMEKRNQVKNLLRTGGVNLFHLAC